MTSPITATVVPFAAEHTSPSHHTVVEVHVQTQSATAHALPTILQGPQETFFELISLINAGQLEEILSKYTPTASLLGCLATEVADTPDKIKAYYTALLNRPGLTVSVHVEPAVLYKHKAHNGQCQCKASGQYRLSYQQGQPGHQPQQYTVVADFLLVLVNYNGHWKIQEHHTHLNFSN